MTNSIKAFALASALMAVVAVPASAAIVVNGGFEDDPGVIGLQNGNTYAGMKTGSGKGSWDRFNSLPGLWTTTSGPGIEIQTKNTLPTIDPHGVSDYYVELDSNSNSAMKQVVNLGVGRYLLSFFYSPRDDRVASNPIDYAVGGLFSLSVTGPSAVDPVTAVGMWTEIKKEFVVTKAGAYDLTFAAGGDSNSYGGFIDDVSIAAIPVPAALPLLGLALAGLGFAARRRKAA
jgi:hypothetical protein